MNSPTIRLSNWIYIIYHTTLISQIYEQSNWSTNTAQTRKDLKLNILQQSEIYKCHNMQKNEIVNDQITYNGYILSDIITQH